MLKRCLGKEEREIERKGKQRKMLQLYYTVIKRTATFVGDAG